ncbi:hypothetical protein HK405_010851 [Cladochytrium tenue]|nr:hypothetical protein HK405_010851 [Cladochytrium tenue]
MTTRILGSAAAAAGAAFTVAAVLAAGPRGALAACGSGLSACGALLSIVPDIQACYNPSTYTCIDSVLCPAGDSLCGTACYSPSSYHCSGTTLLSGAATTTSSSSSSSSSSSGTTYTLKDTYQGSTFFNGWTFFTDADPTSGFVQYVSKATASASGLISAGSPTIIRTDTSNKYSTSSSGRPSVRITSNNAYNAGTVVAVSLNHMPYGCGTWPAFWMFGPDWPNNGEVDIIEGVNTNTLNQMTLHTGTGCTMVASQQVQVGTTLSTDCYAYDNGNEGCSVQAANTASYGTGFNSAGGGVFVMEWTTSSIKIWRFTHSGVPAGFDSGSTVTPSSSWGTPAADFPLGSSCSASHFNDMNIIFDLTFCGSWAGSVFSCSGSGNDACKSYVGSTPSAFTEAYWSINYVKVFKS